MKNYKMNTLELQVTLSFCVIFLLRMLGMFMILPVLSKYGILLNGSNKFLIGLSIGIYGITQVVFQIPFGIFSDKFGRKRIMILGLFMFFIGNVISATTSSIWGLIIGRAIQGSGAVSGVSMAFLSDLIREENRVKAFAAVGSSFAVSFLISMIIGPIIIQYFSFFSLFWVSSFLSIICILIVYFVLPSLDYSSIKRDVNVIYNQYFKLFVHKKFFGYYLSIFCLHFLLMMNFMIIPNQFELSGLSLNNHWKVYLSTILVSFFILFLFIFYCKVKFILESIIEICIFILFCSSIIFLKSEGNLTYLILSLQLFFISFSFLEVFLPENLNKNILSHYKGSIMSIYSASQFLGISFGGILSGWLYSFLSFSHMFLFEIFFISLWLTIVFIYKKYY